jgi:hypothetical protein
MAAKNSVAKVWYVDGVSCLGKTTFVSDEVCGLKMDYAERTRETPFFRNKACSHIVQILYTSSFCQKVFQRLRSSTKPVTFVDRSPISDVWYELLFKHLHDYDYFEQIFEYIEELDMFGMIPTVFVQPHVSHTERILEKMKSRANGLDNLSLRYVQNQIEVFERIIHRFQHHSNVRVIRIAAEQEIFSESYFSWLKDELFRVTGLRH